MKKEKTVRTYQRRTKSGKVVTVHEHKASYDAAEEARKAAKRTGAGSELAKKKAVKEESPLGFSAEDYKEWYHWDQENDENNEAALRVEKTLRKKMGKRAYDKYFNDMSDSYSARGHKKAHQALLDEHTARQKKQDAEIKSAAKDIARGAKEKATEGKEVKLSTYSGPQAKYYKHDVLDNESSQHVQSNGVKVTTSDGETYYAYKGKLYGKVPSTDRHVPSRFGELGSRSKFSPNESDQKKLTEALSKSKGSGKSTSGKPKTSGGTPTSADLRKQADEMDAKAYKETSRAAHKKLIEKGYKKYTWQGHTYYHKGKEGSYSGSYVTLDKEGNPKPAMSSLKEHFKSQVARSVGKKYKARRLR